MDPLLSVTDLNVEFKFMKVQPSKQANVFESDCDFDFPPLKLSGDVPFYCWPYNHLANLAEFISFTVLG